MRIDPTKAAKPAVRGYEFERIRSINCDDSDEPESWFHLIKVKQTVTKTWKLEVTVPDESARAHGTAQKVN